MARVEEAQLVQTGVCVGGEGCRPEGSVTDFARCLHHPLSLPALLPPWLAPQEGLSGQLVLVLAAACQLVP